MEDISLNEAMDLDDAATALALITKLGQAIQTEKKLGAEYLLVLQNKVNPEFDEESGMMILTPEEEALGGRHGDSFREVCGILNQIKIFGLQLSGEDTSEMETVHKQVFGELLT